MRPSNFTQHVRRVLFFLFLLTGLSASAHTYYWVGGSGNWSDFASHWATSSGGSSFYLQIPQSGDDVVFDANSFTATGQTVTVNVAAVCRNMNWTGVQYTPTFQNSNGVTLHGSLTLVSAMNANGGYTFAATTTGHTVTSGGKQIGLNFSGVGGGWTLQDNLNMPNSSINLSAGTLNTNGKSIDAYSFQSSGSSVRSLITNGSSFTLRSAYPEPWKIEGSNISLSTAQSDFTITGVSAYFYHNISGGTYRNISFTATTGNARLWATSTNYNNITASAGLILYATNSIFNDVSIGGYGEFQWGNNTFHDLSLTAGNTYNIYNTQTLTGTLTANGTCTSFITMNGSGVLSSSQSQAVSYVTLKNIQKSGSGIFTAINTIDQGGNTGWSITPLSGQTLYWVGGSGNWSDGSHWSLTSGGAPLGCIPTSLDNVRFDANSFTATGQTVTVNVAAQCINMDWTGVQYTPTFQNSNGVTLQGSLTLVSAMNANGGYSFVATTTGHTVTSGGKQIGLNFSGVGGGWTLQDNLNMPNSSINLSAGTLNTNGKSIDAYSFQSSGSSVRSLITNGSSFTLRSAYPEPWKIEGSNISLSTAQSDFTITGVSAYFYHNISGGTYRNISFTATTGNARLWATNTNYNNITASAGLILYATNSVFNDVSIGGYGEFTWGNNTFHDLSLTAGNTYNIYNTQTLTGTLTANGTCTSFITMNGSGVLSSSQSQAVSYVTLKNIQKSGSGIFTAINTIDQGGNTGWSITPLSGQTLYWVGGSGNWSDGSHWSLTSGGAPLGCIPTSLDNVRFDANSFTATGQTVTVNVAAQCINMDWTGVQYTPTFQNSNGVTLQGSLTLVSAMNANGGYTFAATTTGHTVTSGGKAIGLNFSGVGGGWTLQDNLNMPNSSINLSAGTLNTNGKSIDAYSFQSSGSSVRSLITNGSSFTLRSAYPEPWKIEGSNISLSTAQSDFTITGVSAYFYHNISGGTYRNISFTATTGNARLWATNTNYNNITASSGLILYATNSVFNDVSIGGYGEFQWGNNTFHDLSLTAGNTYNIYNTQTFTGMLNASGTGGYPILINGTGTFRKTSGTVCLDYVRVQNMTATGGATWNAGPNSQNITGNVGWNFAPNITTISVSINTPSACVSSPMVFTAVPVNGGTATYEWFLNNVSVQNGASATYTNNSLNVGDLVKCIMTSTFPCGSPIISNSNTITVLAPFTTATVSSNSNVLVGNTLNLSAGGGATYAWTGPGGFTSTQQNPSISNAQVANSGTYTVTVTSAGGCTAVTSVIASVTPPPATGLSFDGGDDYVRLASTTAAALPSTGGTWEAWVKKPNWHISAYTDEVLFGNEIYFSGVNGSFYISLHGGVGYHFRYGSGSDAGNIYTSSMQANNFAANSWHHLAATWNRAGGVTTISLYMDGTLVASNTTTLVIPAFNNLYLGGMPGRITTNTTMDEVRIWNRALCQGEIQNNMNCALSNPTAQNGLVAHYPLNQGYLDTNNSGVNFITDASANSQNATLFNFGLTGTTSNWVAGTVTGTCTQYTAPSATITASGPTTFCSGGSATLTVNTGDSYLWSNGATSQSINVTQSGNYSVTVTSSGCTATSSATTVTVNAIPTVAAITGSPSVCASSTIQLSNATSGGVWSSTNPSIASVDASGVVTGMNAGSATISYTVTNPNGCSKTVTTNVNVFALPSAVVTAAGPTSFCSGGSVVLNVSFGIINTYQWKKDGVDINGAVGSSYTATSTGNYTVTVTGSGCSVTSEPTAVTVNATPSVSITGNTTGCESVTLQAAGGTGYTWSGGNSVSSATNTFTTSGTYNVTVTNANNCSATASATVTVLPGISAVVNSTNPTCTNNGTITITNPQGPSGIGATLLSTDFSSQPAGSTVGGYASVTGGILSLTPPQSSTDGLLIFAHTASKPSAFVASFDFRIADGNGADGVSFNYGIVSPYTNYEYGIVPTGLAIGISEYQSNVRIVYNGSHLTAVNVGGLMNASYRNCTVTVNASNQVTVSIAGTPVITNYQLPAAYASADKSAWVFGFAARCGGLNNRHTIDNVLISEYASLQYSVDGTNWQTANTFSLPAGTYNVQARSGDGSVCGPKNIGNITLALPANPAAPVANSASRCGTGTVVLSATPGAGEVIEWYTQPSGGTSLTTGNSLSVFLTATTTYYAQARNTTTGCISATRTAAVATVINVAVPVVSGDLAVCAGSTTQLSGTPTGGIWSSVSPVIASVSSAGLVSGLNVGTATINYTVTESGCTATKAVQVVVNPTPTVIFGLGGSAILDQSVSHTDVGYVCLANTQHLAQSFTAGQTGNLSKISIYYSHYSSCNSVYKFTASILSGDSWSGSVLATTHVSVPLPYNLNWLDISFATPAFVTTGQQYTIKIVPDAGQDQQSCGNECGGWRMSGNTNYSGGMSYLNGSSTPYWGDKYFRTYVGSGGVNPVMCVNASPVTLSGGTPLGGVYSGTGVSNGVFNPAVAGTGSHTITYTYSNGNCQSSATAVFTVNPLPVVTAISGASAVCAGSVIQLTNTTPGGVWSSTNSGIAAVDQTGAVTGIAAGTATLSYTVTNASNCSAVVTTGITVNPLPTAAISGTTTVCKGAGSPVISFTGSNATTPYTFTYTINGGTPQTVTSSGNTATVTVPTTAAGSYVYALVSVQDASGTTCTNTASGSATVTVNASPVFTITPSNMVVSTGTDCKAIVSYNAVVSGVPAPSLSYTFTGATTGSGSGTGSDATFNKGTTTVTISAINTCATSTFSFTVHVKDDVPPAAICKNITVYLNAAGTATITAGDINNGSYDNCGISSLAISKSTFNCTNLGANNVTLTVTDNAAVQPVAPQSTGTGSVPIGLGGFVQSFTASSTGNLTGLILRLAYSYSTKPGVTIQVREGAGPNGNLLSTQSAILTPPTGSYPENVQITQYNLPAPVSLVSGNIYSIVVWGSGDIYSSQVFSNNPYPGGQFMNLWGNPANNGFEAGAPWNMHDIWFKTLMEGEGTGTQTGSGSSEIPVAVANVSTCTAVVTVLDNINPTITAPSHVTVNTNSGCTATGVNLGTPVTADNCSVSSVTNNAPATFPIGTTTVIWTVTDGSGNTATATQTVTVSDVTAPSVSCPPSITVLCASDVPVPGIASVTASDNCSVVISHVSDVISNQTAPNKYTITRTYKATDPSGNSASCTQIITVNDNIVPVINCPISITRSATHNQCSRVETWAMPTATDNCNGVVTVEQIGGLPSGSAYPVGINTITLRATDASGNTTECSFTITIVDLQTPYVYGVPASALTVQCDAVPAPAVLTASDNCDPNPAIEFTETRADGSCPGNYTLTRKWVAKDNSNNSSIIIQVITVVDNTPPVITCPANIEVNSAPGQCGNYVPFAATATDNCGTATVAYSIAPNSFFTIGTTTVTATATDACGNQSTCSFTVTVRDNENPVIVGKPANISQSNDAGVCGAVITWDAPTVTDNCTSATLSSTHQPGSLFPVGTTIVTYTATDAAGNTVTHSFTVIIADTEKPTITVPANIVLANDNNKCAASVVAGTPYTNDNCGVSSTTGVRSDGLPLSADYPVGATTITWTVVDIHNNSASATQTITVNDMQKPVIAGMPSNITVNALNLNCAALVWWQKPTASDNCGMTNLVSSDYVFDALGYTFLSVGVHTITYTATDIHGNQSTASFTVTVVDNQPPIITGCPGNITVNAAAGRCDAVVNWNPPTASDNCPGVSLSTSHIQGSVFPVGNTLVTYTATDHTGLVTTCSFTVTVVDNQPPVLSGVPSNVTVSCDAVPAAATVTAADNCSASVPVFSQTITAGNCPGNYTITRTWSTTDAAGNTTTAAQVITVQDIVAPVLSMVPANTTVSCDAIPAAAVLTATDNCDAAPIVTYSETRTNGSCPGNYILTRTWTATDACGNISSKTQVITVQDNSAPVLSASPSDLTVSCDAVPAAAVLTANDNCDEAPVVAFTQTRIDGNGPGNYTLTRVWTATDACGNSSSHAQVITVHDTYAPVPTLATLPTITGECSASVTAPTAIDNCAGLITGTTTDATSYTAQGTYTITWSFNDGNGNISTQAQILIVKDITAPVPTVATLPIITDECSVTVTAPMANDNCSGTITGTTNDPLSYTVQGTYTIIWSFNDGNGNIATQTQTVIVKDITAPVPTVATLPSVIGECSATVTAPTATDNCAGLITGTTNDLLSYSAQGTYIITWSFNDGNGNISTQTQTVIVKDITAPVSTIATLPTVTGECSATVTAPTATDNCAGMITGTTNDPLSYSAQGTYTITWSFNDGNGNIATQTQTVIVKDITAPVPTVATLPSVIAECSATVTAPTATDNCAGLITGTTNDPLSYSAQGTYTITWSFNDGNGNISTQIQTVIVKDITAPVPTLATLAIITGQCNATVTVAPTASDACTGLVTATTTDPLSYTVQGTYTITWTYTDIYGNSSQQIQTVIVKDNIAPVPVAASLPTITGQCSAGITLTQPASSNNDDRNYRYRGIISFIYNLLDYYFDFDDNGHENNSNTSNGNVQYMAAPKATDNCKGTIIGTTTDPLVYTTQGTHVIHWVFDDGNGNSTVQEQLVIVKDNVAPVPTASVLPTIVGQCSVSIGSNSTDDDDDDANDYNWGPCRANRSIPTAKDNCKGLIYATTTDPLTYNRAGTYTIRWVFDDGNGNSTTQNQTVIVKDQSAPKPVVKNLPTIIGSCSATVTTVPTAKDNCVGIINGTTTDPLTYTVPGTYTIRWKYNDGNGNTTTQTQTVVVRDETAPVPAVTTLPAITGECFVSVTARPTATDNCGGVVTVSTSDPLTYTARGTYTIRWKYTDASGNITTQNQTVVVKDVTAPVVVAPANTTVNCGGSKAPSVTGTATATDNCTGSISISYNDATSGNTTTRTWKATDATGNIGTATQTITTIDNTKPVVRCPGNITISCGASIQPNSCGGSATATDNCDASPTIAYTDYNSGNTIIRTWTATDDAGNTSSCTQTITIVDNTKPVLTEPNDVTIGCNASTLPANTGMATATDNCSTPVITYTDQQSGNTITRTWKAMDAAGNFVTDVQKITLGSSFNPVITSVPTNSTYTGGIATNLYLGYGAQSTKLQVCDLPASGAPYTYSWSGSAINRLNNTSTAAPVFTPSAAGSYMFTVTVTNKYGCSYTDNISICVTDIRVPGTGGSKVYVCHKSGSGKKAVYLTLQVSINAVSGHLNHGCGNNDDDDRLGSCDQAPCNSVAVNASVTSNKQGITAETDPEVKATTIEEDLKVTVMPNPSTTYFTLKLESRYETPVNMRVMDGNGRVVDAKSKIGANSTFQIGHTYSSGTYYAELIQGGRRKVVQLIKARG